jgi:hypothetical protein
MKLAPSRRLLPLILLIALALPASAAAAGTPGSATLDNDWHATFSFTQAADEDNAMINVAPGTGAVDQAGAVIGATIGDDLAAGQSTYRTPDPMHAGTYYWQLSSYDTTQFDRHLSAPMQFVVPPILAKPQVTLTCTHRNNLSLRATWRTNVEDLRITYRVLLGRKVVDSVKNYPIWTSVANVGKPDSKHDGYEPFLASRFAKNAKFTVSYSITGQGVSFHKNLVAICR